MTLSMNSKTLLLPLAGLLLAGCQTTSRPDRFAQADRNGDGRLSRDEVHDFMVTSIFATRDADKNNIMTKAEWNDPADNALFNLRDANKDGGVSLAEAKAYSKKVGKWDAVIKETDTNKDGFVSREEAAAYYGSKEGPMR